MGYIPQSKLLSSLAVTDMVSHVRKLVMGRWGGAGLVVGEEA